MANYRTIRNGLKLCFLYIALNILFSCNNNPFGNLSSELKQVKATFYNPDKSTSAEFKLLVADTDSSRQRGLMYIKNMPELEGMLFIFSESRKLSFWMRNTYISLDMIFLDANKKVVGVLKRVPILNDKERNVDAESQYVVEINAGLADKYGIKEGSSLIY